MAKGIYKLVLTVLTFCMADNPANAMSIVGRVSKSILNNIPKKLLSNLAGKNHSNRYGNGNFRILEKSRSNPLPANSVLHYLKSTKAYPPINSYPQTVQILALDSAQKYPQSVSGSATGFSALIGLQLFQSIFGNDKDTQIIEQLLKNSKQPDRFHSSHPLSKLSELVMQKNYLVDFDKIIETLLERQQLFLHDRENYGTAKNDSMAILLLCQNETFKQKFIEILENKLHLVIHNDCLIYDLWENEDSQFQSAIEIGLVHYFETTSHINRNNVSNSLFVVLPRHSNHKTFGMIPQFADAISKLIVKDDQVNQDDNYRSVVDILNYTTETPQGEELASKIFSNILGKINQYSESEISSIEQFFSKIHVLHKGRKIFINELRKRAKNLIACDNGFKVATYILENDILEYDEFRILYDEIMNNLSKCVTSESGINVLTNLIRYPNSDVKKIAQFIKDNFMDVARFENSLNLLHLFTRPFSQDRRDILASALKHIPELAKLNHGKTIIKDLLDACSQGGNCDSGEIKNNVLDNMKDFDSFTILKATEAVSIQPWCKELAEKFEERVKASELFSDQLIFLGYLSQCDPQKNNNLSQTEQHLLTHFRRSPANFYIDHYDAEQLLSLVTKLNRTAKKLEQEGYVTFVHGQRWPYELVERWFTKLHALNNEISDDFLFLHVKQLPENLEVDTEMREQLLKYGRFDDYSRQQELFMNYAFFANSATPGSNSALYIKDNHNVGSISLSIKDAFALNNYSKIYDRYAPELEELAQAHAALSNYGNAVLIAVPKDLLPHVVYSAKSGGYKRPLKIDGKPTENITKIMDTLRTNPSHMEDSDNIEFCLIMTRDIAMNPKSGIKYFMFNAADPEKMKAFKQKEEALFAKIKQAIECELEPRVTEIH
jgi:hypothetical protein